MCYIPQRGVDLRAGVPKRLSERHNLSVAAMGGCRPAFLLSLLVCTGLRPSEASELRRSLRRSTPGLVTWKVVSRAVAKRRAHQAGKSRPRYGRHASTRSPTTQKGGRQR